MEKSLLVINRSYTYRIPFDEILYIIQDYRNVNIVTNYNDMKTRGRIGDYLVNLDDRFIRCHSFCVVNAENISQIGKNKIYFFGEKKLILGQVSFAKFRKCFHEYAEKRRKEWIKTD